MIIYHINNFRQLLKDDYIVNKLICMVKYQLYVETNVANDDSSVIIATLLLQIGYIKIT